MERPQFNINFAFLQLVKYVKHSLTEKQYVMQISIRMSCKYRMVFLKKEKKSSNMYETQ